ncbi:MAG: transcription elongation factor Spt5 [Infirmifilum sp.]|uniref:Transcription elongation factor Spt5 n=1 Tax=Infirmifilum uzonense TaxID=1550241 RepID=A0A0F7CLC6_9CREN|nr:transcription elongation factor Spt5 [Infirmifilum uzonense]AKG39176.1 hypothetical protein MA03_07930 [Infirmifilum uzonense]
MGEKSSKGTRFYAFRVTVGQEYNVAQLLYNRAKGGGYRVYSIVVVPGVRGLVFIECDALYEAQRLVMGMKHVRGAVRGAISYQEMEALIKPKPIVESVKVGDIIEIIRGPFAGMRGKIVSVDPTRNEVKVELAEAVYVLPVTISAEDIKVVQKAEAQS